MFILLEWGGKLEFIFKISVTLNKKLRMNLYMKKA